MEALDSPPPPVLLDTTGLRDLIALLHADGYEVLGPRVRDGAVVYDALDSIDDLPQGWRDDQDGGHYRLDHTEDARYFGYTSGVQSWKRFLSPPERLLWRGRKGSNGSPHHFTVESVDDTPPKQAFVGVRPCELAAIQVQDRVYLEGPFVDPVYAARRADTCIIAVNCGSAGGSCFCTSMGTGPRTESGFDLALTELVDATRHDFLVEVGSEVGAALLDRLSTQPATDADLAAAQEVTEATAAQITRHLDTEGVHDLLLDNPEHPRWDTVADRCLACANCTMVCPTCFCVTVEDTTDLTGTTAERHQRWDSCFTVDFSYIHGGSVRTSTKARYRQWLTHKLATWQDQFGTSGCVGCGRCITWCPVAIDLTEEVAAIRGDSQRSGARERTRE